ncbi:amidohydrolase family protein [Nesterenkonia sp. AY15]|uniref:N-acetylglucosamine-6-phosphate deacetylase n=1 Tax=Nesterenkonia sp. AY15 TaxID=2901139 RepID=UPI001F4CAE9B|nr:amidohydrolase family protein [Nesterenkonia sp. AY15]MCH8571631.1 amidohydrolase family protein [Nesterenkonia sp. AY15]
MTNTHRQVILGRIHTGLTEHAEGALAIENERITYAGAREYFDPEGWPVPDVLESGDILVPGFVDTHCHGAFGADFSTSAEEPVRQALAKLHEFGTTTVVASLVTARRDEMLRAAALFGALTIDGSVAGIHLEGPFLSHARCGAQDPQWLMRPDLELTAQLIQASGGTIRAMTYAPELEGAITLVEFLTSLGVVPSIGHTDADASTTEASLAHARQGMAASRGIGTLPTVTHLFNGMPTIHHRSPGPAMACLRAAARGEAVIELIADTLHLDPYTVESVFELVGADNIALVTDSMAAAGLDDGTYRLGPATVHVNDAAATLSSSSAIAGGTAFMRDIFRNTVRAGVPFDHALRSATVVPAHTHGLSERVGRLASGLHADAVILNDDLNVARVLRRGTWIA